VADSGRTASMRGRKQIIGQAEILEPAKQGAKAVSTHILSEDKLLTINEVSELIGLAVGTLYHFVSERRIPVVRLSKRCIRFRYSDLLEWIETHTEKCSGS
jgi:excisionase family DNA binding protein